MTYKEPEQNYTKIPNPILDVLDDMSEIELKLTMCLVRYTFGYHSERVQMTYEIMQDRTGMSRGSISRAIDLIEKRGFFIRGRKSYWHMNSLRFEPCYVHEDVENSTNFEEKSMGNSSKFVPTKRKEDIKEREREAPANAFWIIPENLKVKEFLKMWKLWLKHVDEAGLTFTETQAALKLAELSDAGLPVAVNSVKVTLSRGWKNVYITDEGMTGRAANTAVVPHRQEIPDGNGGILVYIDGKLDRSAQNGHN